MATAKQVDFIMSLVADRDNETFATLTRDVAEHFTTAAASSAIKALLASPRKSGGGTVTATLDAPKVPAGRYAVENADGRLMFYRLWRPDSKATDGPFALYVQAGDEGYRLRGVTAREVMAKIVEDGPVDAMRRYGHEIGKCGICGRTLTDEVSRANGIGPVCEGRFA